MENLQGAMNNMRNYFTDFRTQQTRAFGNFDTLVPSLQGGLAFTDVQKDAVSNPSSEARRKLESALTNLPKYRKGLTGADSGHLKTATPASVVALLLLTVQTGFSIYDFVKGIQDGDEAVPSTQLITQLGTLLFVGVSIMFWAVHAWNARDAAKAASVRPTDEATTYWIQQYVKAAKRLSDAIAGAEASGAAGDLPAPDALGARFIELHSIYDHMLPAQQDQLGRIELIKEAYLNRILAIAPNNNPLGKLLQRVQITSTAMLGLSNKAAGSFKMADHLDGGGAIPGVVADDLRDGLAAKIKDVLDAANGSLAAVADGPLKRVLLNHPKATKLIHSGVWMKLERYIGPMEFITLPGGGQWYKNRTQVGDASFAATWTKRRDKFAALMNRANEVHPAMMV